MSSFEVTDGVYGIDVELFDAGFNCVYLFDDESPTLVDAGTATGAETVLDGMRACGVAPADLENVVLSHIHVDHCGATSALVEAGHDVDVYLHELTAPNLAEPSGLVESSRQAMGDHFDQIGAPDPVPADAIVEVPDEGTAIDIGTNTLEMVHAPGHSPDHCAVWNPEQRLLYAAECLGGYLERADQWFPPSTVPNFDVELLDEAIDQLRALEPDTILFPHFGVWPGDPETAFETARTELHRFDERILELHDETGSVEATTQAVVDELLAISPPYAEQLESFYGSLVTTGYLMYHDRL
jgi:glyoxylase-like metal-dependent hydrolase (beta-lactamase superfamily II)